MSDGVNVYGCFATHMLARCFAPKFNFGKDGKC